MICFSQHIIALESFKIILMKKLITFIKTQKYSFPFFLLLICLFAYGILIPLLGLYWDGWPYMWQYHVFGISGYPAFVASDRPHSAWIFMLLTGLFGYNIMAYHIAAFFFHWISALLIWWLLNILWPDKKPLNALVALFFCIYPGFLQQSVSLPYCHHLSHMAMFYFSIWGMLFSLHNPRKYWWLIVASVLSCTIVNFSIEYFTALEILRPVLIWMVLRKEITNQKHLIKRTFKMWLPYLVALIGFLIWRTIVFKFPTYTPVSLEEISSLRINDSTNLISTIARDLFTISVTAWGKVFRFPTVSSFGSTATYLFYGLFIMTILVSISYFFLQKEPKLKIDRIKSMNSYSIQLIGLGFLSVILSGSVFWLLNLPIQVEFAWDRLNLSFALGVSLCLVGSITLLLKLPWMKILTISLLTGLAVGFHFQNTMSFKREWESFQNFFWQLTWRAPELKPGTVILTTNFPLKYYSDNSLTAPLNWTYDPDSQSNQLQYMLYFTDVRLASQRLSKLAKDIPITQPYRTFFFEGNTNHAIVVKYSPPACLQIMDPMFTNSQVIPNLNELEAEEIPLSNLDQIITDSGITNVPPVELIPYESPHDWCYYFEKADLARQKGDWQAILSLSQTVDDNSLKPRSPQEWLPFMEAFIRVGQWDKVSNIIESSIKISQDSISGICYTMERIATASSISQDTIQKLKNLQAQYNCQ